MQNTNLFKQNLNKVNFLFNFILEFRWNKNETNVKNFSTKRKIKTNYKKNYY